MSMATTRSSSVSAHRTASKSARSAPRTGRRTGSHVGLVDHDATYVESGAGAEPVAVGGDLDPQAGVSVASETVEVPAPEQAQRRPASDHPARSRAPCSTMRCSTNPSPTSDGT